MGCIPTSLPLSVITGQPISVTQFSYRIRMDKKPKKPESGSKRVARENVAALLKHKHGALRSTGMGLLKAAGIPHGNAQRMMEETDVSWGTLDQVAKVLGVDPWQLLVPGLDPAQLPTLANAPSLWPFPMVSEDRYLSLGPEDRAYVQAKADAAIESREASRGRYAVPSPSESSEVDRRSSSINPYSIGTTRPKGGDDVERDKDQRVPGKRTRGGS